MAVKETNRAGPGYRSPRAEQAIAGDNTGWDVNGKTRGAEDLMAGRDDTGGGQGDTPSRHQGGGRADEGFGDDGGTRVGRPDNPQRANAAPGTGTGSEIPDAEEGSIL